MSVPIRFLSPNSDTYIPSIIRTDLPTNAKPERHDSLHIAEKVSKRLWLHITFISWTGIIKLCVGVHL
jgi:hypothetical protein